MSDKVKAVVIGPVKSGKTFLSNFLADATESSTGEYHPTQGVRILEFESAGGTNGSKKTSSVEVELWDCSGDPNHQMHGVIYVYNPEITHQDQDLETFYDYFSREQRLKSAQCLIVANNKSGGTQRSVTKPPSLLSGVQTVLVEDLQGSDGEALRSAFHGFLKQLVQIQQQKQKEQEEDLVA